MKDTSCKECCFAQYNDITQIDCELNLLEKYEEHGIKILPAYDEDKEFFVIQNKLCPYKRSQDWHDKVSDGGCIQSMLDYENRFAYHVILFIDGDLKKIRETVSSLISQEHTPVAVSVVKQPSDSIPAEQIASMFEELKPPFKWGVRNLTIEMSGQQAIHMVQKTAKSQYYLVARTGYIFLPDTFAAIDKAVIDGLIKFAAIETDWYYIIPNEVHNYWYFNGNPERSILHNIRDYQCENKDQKLIYTMKEIRQHALCV